MKKLLILPLLMATHSLHAGFDFGECSGSKTFEQQIEAYGGDNDKAVLVGEIPAGIKGLHVELNSDKDIDIRLLSHLSRDRSTEKIVRWPDGILNQPELSSTLYKNIDITYSGYNGIDGQKGHEFIDVNGTIPNTFTLKAFGYQAGLATVNYSWTGKEGCTASKTGSGHFEQDVLDKNTTVVGSLPKGIENLEVNLTSDKDIDIQLYGEDGTAIIAYPGGKLEGNDTQEIDYNNMHIEWSGYNGTNGHKGNEYIKISGKTTEQLTMKVYGYEAGSANVNYSWGIIEKEGPCTKILPVCGINNLVDCNESNSTCGQITFQNMCKLNKAEEVTFLHNGACENNASNQQEEFDKNRALWNKTKEEHNNTYSFDVDGFIVSPSVGIHTIYVKNGTIDHTSFKYVEYNTSNGQVYDHNITDFPPNEIYDTRTIDDYFDMAQDDINDSGRILTISYDKNTGAPTYINSKSSDPKMLGAWYVINIKNIKFDDNNFTVCTEEYAPVCGIDNNNLPCDNIDSVPCGQKTFGNMCKLNVAKATFLHVGPCKKSSDTNDTEEIIDANESKPIVPESCVAWFDGCNNCKKIKNGSHACTQMNCPVYKEFKCTLWKDDVNDTSHNYKDHKKWKDFADEIYNHYKNHKPWKNDVNDTSDYHKNHKKWKDFADDIYNHYKNNKPWEDYPKDKYDYNKEHKIWTDFAKNEYNFYKDHKPWKDDVNDTSNHHKDHKKWKDFVDDIYDHYKEHKPWEDYPKDKYDHHKEHKIWTDFAKDEYNFYKDHKPWNFSFSW